MRKILHTYKDTESLGAELYRDLKPGSTVFLHGPLGAGKTTLVRGFLRAAGYTGTVKSPTYNLVEEYFVNSQKIYHFDLYRLNNSEELEYIGIDHYFGSGSTCFIEWPDNFESILPDKHIKIKISKFEEDRTIVLSST